MNNTNTPKDKVDLILEKKYALDKTIHEYEKRIDEKLASLAENELPPPKLNTLAPTPFIQKVSIPDEHYLSGIDISDDEALDQAVLNSKPFSPPGNKLAFEDGQLAEEAPPSLTFPEILNPEEDDEIPTLSKILGRVPDRSVTLTTPKGNIARENTLGFSSTEASLDPQTTPLGSMSISQEIPEDASFLEINPLDLSTLEKEDPSSGEAFTQETSLDSSDGEAQDPVNLLIDEPLASVKSKGSSPLEEAPIPKEFLETPLSEEPVLKKRIPNEKTLMEEPPTKKESFSINPPNEIPPLKEEKPSEKEDYESVIYEPLKERIHKTKSQPQKKHEVVSDVHRGGFPLKNLAVPTLLFVLGIIALGGFLIFASPSFTFVDYSVLFILFTCLIFTIALPYSAVIFLMLLLLCSYTALTLISVFYIGVPFELYQLGWIIIIPLVLWSASLLVLKIKTSFSQKNALVNELVSFETLEEASGLTIEKAYYKDLKNAMDRATKGETILVLEMMTIAYSDAIKPIIGPRLWDEILYKTLNIIKKHCFNTHLIYILDGHIFSVIMENTSMKNQLMINQGIIESFNVMIKTYDSIDISIELDIASLPFSREIKNPFDYRSIGTRLLKK